MKICFVCNEYPPMPGGGIGVFAKTLAEALVNLGLDVSVVGFGKKGPRPFTQNGVKVFWLSLPSVLYRSVSIKGYPYSIANLLRRYLLSAQLNQLVRALKIDIVESHDFNGPLAFKPPAKLIVRLHGSVLAYRFGEGRPTAIHPLDRFYEAKQLQMADRLVAVSRHAGELTSQALGKRLDYQVIYNGVDTSLFSPQHQGGDSTVLFVGNVMWRKGVFDLIKALPFVLERYPSVRLKIVGGAGGAHLEHLKAALSGIPETARERVDMFGHVPHESLPALYNGASVFVFPSRVEAFGLTCAEAMACGRPVVATNLASGPELVEDGISGLLSDPTSPADLAEKITDILDDAALAKKLGEHARRRVIENFDLRDIGPRNMAFYQSLL